MSSRVRLFLFALIALLVTGSVVSAQSTTAGTVSGVIVSSDRLPLPGVTVTATSPSMQGARETVSDENGVFYLRGLLPGPYLVQFTLSGFQSAIREAVPVSAGGLAVVDVTLGPAAVTETVTVTATAPAITLPRTAQTYRKTDVDRLPVGRRPVDVAELAPGVTANLFNVAQLTLAGAFGFDNVFLVNGVDINDNVFGTSNNLFIEDAIEETTVFVHGVPAEFGRFSGGVINVVTRSGGNVFSGSLREGFSNPKWIGRTPLERAGNITHADVLSTSHEGTVGGPIVRDRLWFFTAGRADTANTPNTFAQNGAGYTRTDRNRRFELKLTGTLASGHAIQGSFVENATEQRNASAVGAGALLDQSMLTTRQLPNRMFAASYNGSVGRSYFATLQFSEKRQGFSNNGGTSTALTASPFRTRGVTAGVPGGLFYHGPYLDATDPEQRNNRQVAGSLSRLVSTDRFGSHDLKGGAEHFISTGIGGNSQSASGYVFATDYLTSAGAVVRDAAGTPIPVFTPNVTQVFNFQATRGAAINIHTTSLYLQDRWTAAPRLTLDLGTRFEMVRADATGDITTVDTTSIVPRFGATYDLFGDARTLVTASYGHYAGKYGQVQFGVNTNVGRPNEVDYVYTGPAGQGYDFAPGFDLANYSRVVSANFPTANVQVASGIQSPLTREFTAGLGHQFGARGHARATYAWRRASQFVEDFVDLSRGATAIPLVGTLTNRVYDNTGELRRDYQALIVQGGYRPFDRLTLDGHYTLQLENHGNFAGEAANQPGIPSVFGNYPEIFAPAYDRLMPWGRLDNYQQHKLRVMANYVHELGRFGDLSLTPLWRVNSGGVYSLTASIPVPAAQLARNPGYPAADISTATRETVFFGERGAYELKGYGLLDFAATYAVPVWSTVQPWFKVEIYNVLNNQKQIGWDRTVTANNASALDANGIPTGFTQGPRFGQATAGTHFPQPYAGQNGGRAVRFAFGVRF